MGTQYETPQGQESVPKPIYEQDTLHRGPVISNPISPMPPTPPPPISPPPSPPPGPAHPRNLRWVLVSAIAIVLVLAITLGTVLFIQTRPQSPTGQATPTVTTPGATVTPGIDTTPTPAPGVTPGPVTPNPQQVPPRVNDPAYWDGIIGTQSGVTKVERVSFASIMGTPALQALVTVRHSGTGERLDVYVFNNITSTHPTQIFKLTGLLRGDAKISGYSTVMTAEVDRDSALNAGKTITATTPDLFREFAWSDEQKTLVQVAFPGLFPDLTRYQAEADQTRVNQGKDTWKNDPAKVASALVDKFFDWQRASTTKLLSGGGPKDVYATVRVQEAPVTGAQSQGPNVIVTLSRLEGNTHNLWVAVSVVDGTMLTLTNINARQLIASPVTLQGTGAAFEAVIGRAVVYDHLYTDIGHAQVIGDKGMAQAAYNTKVVYTSSYRTGVQEGIVAVYEANGGISDEIYTAVMVKVMLDPAPGVAQGPLPCPDAVKNPAYWNSFVSTPGQPVVAEQVSCGNLFGQPSLQAMVVGREIVGGGPMFRSVFVFDNITAATPKLIFKVTHLLHGTAQISGYSSIMTGEVDINSALNKNKGDSALTTDLYREYEWSEGAGKFVQVAFPGIFPDLTRYQAEMDQRDVNNGKDIWKNDPVKVSTAMADKLLGWSKDVKAKLLGGGGPRDVNASVEVQKFLDQHMAASVIVTLSRLEGNTHNMWVVIGVKDGNAITLANIPARSLIASPVKLEGKGSAFENTIGVGSVLDHLYATVGQEILTGPPGVGMGNNVPYSAQVSYDLSFKTGPQEGVVKISLTSPIGAGPSVLVKVLLDPQPRVAQGPVSCPVALQDPGYWSKLLGIDPAVGGAGLSGCGNLKGDASLQALVGVHYANGQPGMVYVYDQLNSAQPVQIFKLQTAGATISQVSTIMTSNIDQNSSINKGKDADKMVRDLNREYQWSASAGTFVQVAFPGLFPDLTRAQAELDQINVDLGKDTWKNDPAKVASAMTAKFLGWPQNVTTKVLGGGGPRDVNASVLVQRVVTGQSQSPNVIVTLSRLAGNTHNLWVVIGVKDGTMLTLTNINARQVITSPVILQGKGAAFEAVIGKAVVYDHTYADIGHAQIMGDQGMALTTYTTKVTYASTFQAGMQEGIVAVYEANGGLSSDPYTAVLVKVLIKA